MLNDLSIYPYLTNNACSFTTKDSLASYDWENCSDPVENLEFFYVVDPGNWTITLLIKMT